MSYAVVARWVARGAQRRNRGHPVGVVSQCRRDPRSRDFVAQKSVERPNEFLLYAHYGTEQDSPPIENSLQIA